MGLLLALYVYMGTVEDADDHNDSFAYNVI